jgi:hypothetical protein
MRAAAESAMIVVFTFFVLPRLNNKPQHPSVN